MTVWDIQINWNGRWVTVDTGYKSRGEAEWAAAKWKSKHDCHGDPFRSVQALSPEHPVRSVFAPNHPTELETYTDKEFGS